MSKPGDRQQDPLVGSPELFATNLLLVRAIEQGMSEIHIENHEDHVQVQNIHPDRQYPSETLTEKAGQWEKIHKRFQNMTEFDDNDSQGRLKPNTPAQKQVNRIIARYPEPDRIELCFFYPDS